MKLGRLKPWRLGLGAALCLCAGLASAGDLPTYPQCSKKPTAADVEGAKGAHKAATQFYDRADYDRAIQYWRDAYSFDCTAHAVLINIANAYEKKGDKAAAVATLETYLVRDPHAGDAANIAEKVNNLKNSLKETSPTPTAPPTAPPPSASATAAPPPTTAPTTPPPPPAEGGKPFGVVPWIVTGVGAAGVVAGAILLPIGLGKVSDAEAACPDRKHCPEGVASDGNSGRTLSGAGTVALIVGGVAIAGGLVWEFGFNKRKSATTGMLVLAPIAGPTTQGAVLAGSF